MTLLRAAGALAAGLALGACATSHPLASKDAAIADEVVRSYVLRGEDALAELRELSEHEDAAVRARARTAIGRITGQWGADGSGIVWGRDFAAAVEAAEHERKDRPLMLLHLFGNFDEEFC